jgi:pyruvate formate lyase activating enzyme
MIISGLQKLTLLDYPGKIACTIFTGGCNLRCPFCHNTSLVLRSGDRDIISQEEVLAFLKKRAGILDGVCITGGEPLLQSGIGDFIIKIKLLGYNIKLDTNGCFPEKLKQLVRDGLVDYVAMDIKNAPDKYNETVGITNFDISPIEESVAFLLSGAVPYEFRTTVVKELHKPEDIAAIGRWIAHAERYFLQAFVDSGDVIASGLHAYDKKEMEELRQISLEYIPNTEVRGI